MIEELMISIMVVTFPILMYIIMLVLENVIDFRKKNIYMCIFFIISLFLIIRLDYDINLIKILFLVCLFRNNIALIIITITSTYLYRYNIYAPIELIVFLIPFYFLNIRKEYKYLIFILIEMIFNNNIINSFIYTLISFILVKILEKIENIIDVHKIIKSIEYEKKLRETLFEMTHEVKNPIAVIKGYLGMIDYSDIDKLKKYIPIIEEEVNKSLLIMDDFIFQTKLDVKLDIMDLNILINDIVSNYKTIFKEKNIKFSYDLNIDNIYIMGDYDRLKEVFTNIFNNSIESIRNNGIIKLNIEVNSKIEIHIIDNGVGIKDVDKVFNSFYSTKNKIGLGLTFVKEIIDKHKGSIKIKSKVNKGTEIIIKLNKL